MAAVVVDVSTFHSHLSNIHGHWLKNREAVWGNSDALCVAIPKFGEDDDAIYAKSTAASRYLFGYEFSATVLVLTRSELHVLASDKKIKLLEPLQATKGAVKIVLHTVTKDDKNAGNFANLVRAVKGSFNGTKLGVCVKDAASHPGVAQNLAAVWLAHASERGGLAAVEAGGGWSHVLAEKDAAEVGCVQKAAVMSNKVLKHGFVKEMESIFEEEGKQVKHTDMAQKLEDIMEDPSKIGINLPPDTVESCYYPIVQSGGCVDGYNIKPSAVTDDGTLTEDVVIVSLGARYKHYCANVARTYVIDSVPTVETTYLALEKLKAECLAVMQPGGKLVDVHEKATSFLAKRYPHLAAHLPKSLGFSLGLDFKDATFVLTAKVGRELRFKPNMVFNLAVGFQDVPLTSADTSKAKGAIKSVKQFSMLLADTVKISESGFPEVLTKAPTAWNDVSYTIKENDGDDDDGEDDDDGDGEDDDDEGVTVKTAAGKATVLKSRLRERTTVSDAQMESKAKRAEKQARLHLKAQEKGLAKFSGGNGASSSGGGNGDGSGEAAEDFECFKSSSEYPYEAKGSAVHVDMEREVLFLPLGGVPVPFHISTVKNVVMPEPEAKAALLKLNFYTPGQALGKEASPQMAALINAHKQSTDQVFVKEFTFRSESISGIQTAHRLIQELRKRARSRAVKEETEANLVVQAKLIRLKDQRVPRLADIEMRPALAGRKSKGTLDAHTNGCRFTATKTGETVDIMYANVKHAFFQPCVAEHIVLVHFHLHNPIMVGKKKTGDVQFITEVVEASEDVSARGSVYDPDEVEKEQQERKMRKMINRKFQEYTQKVEEVAKRHGFDNLEFDIPYKDLAFQGTPHREMVTMQPSVHCLVNLTETPAFVVSMTTVEHVHFERCTMASKNFDMVFIFKDYDLPPRMVSAVDMKDLDDIQEWLTQQDITYTMGSVNLVWKGVMELVQNFAADGTFWADEDLDGESKPPGWLFLDAEGGDDDDDEDGEGEESDEYEAPASESEESEDEDEESDESFDEEEDESEFDESEEEEAEGQEWEDLEKEAKASDRQRDAFDAAESRDAPPAKKAKKR